MTIALSAKNKRGLVDGTVASSSTNSNLWSRCNDMVISWILNTLNRDISESVSYVTTAKQLWTELCDRYGQGNGANYYQFQKSLSDISQGNCSIAVYFAEIKRIWDEIQSSLIVATCSCGAATTIAKKEEEQRLIQSLMGLNTTYDQAMGNILMMEPLPSVSKAYSMLIHDEK